jgi:uncharacterized membrane protein
MFVLGVALSEWRRDMRFNVRFLTKAAVIAALYAALTLAFQPISFGQVQFRIAEAFTALPLLMPEAIQGLFVGCLIANLLGGGVLLDVVFGSLATLAAAIFTRRLREKKLAALSMPVIWNGLIVGPVVYFFYVMGEGAFSLGALLFTCFTVALGEAVVVYALGLGLFEAFRRTGLDRKL